MKVAFRVDASTDIGTGHVMRCLTLADALTEKGAECEFICREHNGNLISYLRNKNYITHSLELEKECEAVLPHSDWLGATQAQDAEKCIELIEQSKPDWLIVDHYGIDRVWEKRIAENVGHLMVIDDLADRKHYCNLLLDQTYKRNKKDYIPLTPSGCTILSGSNYALLRPEFSLLRNKNQEKRRNSQLKQILISLGGVDKLDTTSKILEELKKCTLPIDCKIIVVMGPTAPWLQQVRAKAAQMSWQTEVLSNINNMAQLMLESDCAIGAAGATSWERCCLGLPSIMVVLAENQRKIAKELSDNGAALLIDSLETEDLKKVFNEYLTEKRLAEMRNAAYSVCDGLGTTRVIDQLYELTSNAN